MQQYYIQNTDEPITGFASNPAKLPTVMLALKKSLESFQNDSSNQSLLLYHTDYPYNNAHSYQEVNQLIPSNERSTIYVIIIGSSIQNLVSIAVHKHGSIFPYPNLSWCHIRIGARSIHQQPY